MQKHPSNDLAINSQYNTWYKDISAFGASGRKTLDYVKVIIITTINAGYSKDIAMQFYCIFTACLYMEIINILS